MTSDVLLEEPQPEATVTPTEAAQEAAAPAPAAPPTRARDRSPVVPVEDLPATFFAAMAKRTPTRLAQVVAARYDLHPETLGTYLHRVSRGQRVTLDAHVVDALLLTLDDHDSLATLPHLYPSTAVATEAVIAYAEATGWTPTPQERNTLVRKLSRFSCGYVEALYERSEAALAMRERQRASNEAKKART